MTLLNWSSQSQIPGATTSGRPQVVEFNGKAYACWGGNNEPNGYYSVFDGTKWSPNQIQIPGVSSNGGPVPVVFNNQLYFFWTYSDVVRYRTFDGDSNWGQIDTVLYANGTPTPSALATGAWLSLAAFQGELFIAFRGESDDDANHWLKNSGPEIGNLWSAPASLAGSGSLLGPELAVYGNSLFAVWQGVAGDDGIWWSTCSDGQHWAGQQRIPGVGTTGIPGLAPLPDRLCAAWKGISGDDAIYCSIFQGNGPWAQPQQKVTGIGTAVGPGLGSFNNQVIAVWQGNPNDPTVWWSTVTPA
jgi:hypothetical protein